MKAWPWFVGLLFLVAVDYLVFDAQLAAMEKETVSLNRDIRKSESILEQAAQIAPAGDTELDALLSAVDEAKRIAGELNSAFVDPADMRSQVNSQVQNALVPAVSVLELAGTGDREREFHSEHEFRLILSGSRADLMTTVEAIEQGPVYVAWVTARWEAGEGSTVKLKLGFKVFALVESPFPPRIGELSVCSPAPPSEVWLPWLTDDLMELRQERQQMCSESEANPLRTAAALELEAYSVSRKVREAILKVLHEHETPLTALMPDIMDIRDEPGFR